MQLSQYDIECLEKARELMVQDPGVRYTVKQLAALTGMGLTKFTDAFKLYSGCPVSEFIHLLRMKKAHTLVTENYLTIKAIAGLCGYRHVSHFNTAFKKHFGISAKKIRTKLNY